MRRQRRYPQIEVRAAGRRRDADVSIIFLKGVSGMKRMGMLVLLVPVILTLTACAESLTAKRMPGADLSPLKTVYVQKLPADERGIDLLIANQLTRMGFIATNGASETSPSPADAIVTYQDKWMWDITMYMLQLSVQIRDGQTRMVLATGQAMHTSLVRKSPEEMVEEVLAEIFKGDRK